MNTNPDFVAKVDHVLHTLSASPRRKRIMQEELLAHLSATYEEELARQNSPDHAAHAALERFGKDADLRHQLQKSVPLHERLLFIRLTSFVPWLMFLATIATMAGGLLVVAAVALLGMLLVLRLWYGRIQAWPGHYNRALFLVGVTAALAGAAIIMPALAKINQGIATPPFFTALTLGFIIIFEGAAVMLLALKPLPPSAS